MGSMTKSLKRFLNPYDTPMTFFERVWLLAPIAIWFSYYPLIRLGSNASTYFEVSVTSIYIAVLSIAGLPILWRHRKHLLKSKGILPITIFVMLCGISLLWTADLTRGILTFGVICALYTILITSICLARQMKKLAPAIVKMLVIWTVIMSALSLIQIIASIWVDRSTVLLCAGCDPQQFGFARPNVFTIEPQFFGNMLLAPALILSHILMSKRRNVYSVLGYFITVTTLFLTLSRGAIFAFGVGLLVLALVEIRQFRNFTVPAVVLLASFVACLLIQGSAAAMNPKLDTSFMQAIRTSVNQLSLGVIDLPNKTEEVTKPVTNTIPQATTEVPKAEVTPAFDGYVAQSTNVRLKLSSFALKSWHDSIPRALFGVGLGGSGVVLSNEFPNDINKREIVQNEFVEVLLENGLIGIIAFTSVIALLFYHLRREKWLWAIIVAFLAQWNFFSGYPNAIHIYLTLILLAVLYTNRQNKAVNRRI